jgi:hypothetical protein
MARQFKNFSSDRTFKRLVGGKHSFLIRKGSEVNQIIHGKNHYLFATPNRNFPKNKLFLFKKVSDDVKKYLSQNSIIDLPPKKNTQDFNLEYDVNNGVITGTDLDHAYWRIAYVKGYISKNTYEHGIKDERSKSIRLATLGVLGTEQKFDRYENGEYVETIIHRRENKLMKTVYKDIRYTCFYMMYEIALMLGEDFESWNTDCIYYRDSKKNREIVNSFFDMHNMLFKQLTYSTVDSFKQFVASEKETDEKEDETETTSK